MNFFGSIIEGLKLIIEYILTIVTSIVEYFGLIMSSSVVFANLVGYLPNVIQVSGMAVVSIAIFKAIFGRQGSS